MAKIWNWIMKRPVFLIFIIGVSVCCIITIRHYVGNSNNIEQQDANMLDVVESTHVEITEEVPDSTFDSNETIAPTESTIETDPTETTENIKEEDPTEYVIEATEMTEFYDNEETAYEETASDISMDDTEMLAIVIYQEAGGDACCDECRRRVADIVLNRVADERFPNTIYEVLTQYGQYGRLYWTGVVWADRANNPEEAEAVERARRIAEEVLSGQHSDVYGNGYIWQAGFAQGSDGFWHCGHFYGR